LRLHSLPILNHKRVHVFMRVQSLVRSKGFYGSSLQVTSLSTMNYAVLNNLVSPPRPFFARADTGDSDYHAVLGRKTDA
jgi:hypothetical protein